MLQKSISGRRTLLWLAVLLLVVVVISYFIAPDKPEEHPAFVSESPSPTGVRALYTYLHNETGSVERWTHDPEHLPVREADQLLIMAEPFFIPDQGKMDDYISFMESGNTILLLKTNPDGMFGLNTTPVEDAANNEVIHNNTGTNYQAVKSSPVRIEAGVEDDILLHDEAGAIAIKRAYGNGTLIAATAPDWMTNSRILDEDHMPLLQELIQEETQEWDAILFDEYMHETGHASSLTNLYPDWLLVLGVQAILLTLMWLWLQGKRFGPIIEPREETVRFSDERIRALASWYQKGHRYQDSLAIQADYVKLLLQERWAIPYYKDWTDIKGQLEQRWEGQPSEGVGAFLDGLIHVLRKAHVNKQEYLLWSKKLDRLQKEVEDDEK
ncbi:DUF4350 domain-containing protein [Virgibacillus natechei]|uniref:DUF4350 domain-containing protein n=1 Tax=Virgibacillus sp. CBA3643 TaxID=2942278 RepID=UPI0035A36A1F